MVRVFRRACCSTGQRVLTVKWLLLQLNFLLPLLLLHHAISVQAYGDPSEVRLSDDQAIFMPIKKDVPNKTYLDKLNAHIKDDKSFIYASRISGDRLCVVFSSASHAKLLVEQIGFIIVENEPVPIKYLVAKSVKVYISNAGYGISNSALKKYLTKDCKIHTSSSVSELKANVDPHDNKVYGYLKSFRRVVYIHPEDVTKLPKTPVKFYTTSIGYNVFFEIDSPKCFNCQQKDHFMANCPNLKEKYQQNTNDDDFENSSGINNLENKSDKHEIENFEKRSSEKLSSGQNQEVYNSKQVNKKLDNAAQDDVASQINSTTTALLPSSVDSNLPSSNLNLNLEYSHVLKTPVKRPLPKSTGSIISNGSCDFVVPTPLGEHSDLAKKEKLTPYKKKNRLSQEEKSNKNSQNKKIILDGERTFQISSGIEPARPYIEASFSNHKLTFDKVVNLIMEATKAPRDQRKKIVSQFSKDSSAILDLLLKIHGTVKGKGIKSKITCITKILDYTDEIPSTTDYDSSESESTS